MFLVGVDACLVAVEAPVVFLRLADVGVFVCGLFVAPVLRHLAVLDRFCLILMEVGFQDGDKSDVDGVPAAFVESGRVQLFADDLEECLGTTFLGELFFKSPDGARIG